MKRIITLLASAALIASGFSIVPAAAQEAPEIPEVANIEDPFGDANTLSGDQVTPADGGSVSDLGKVWFTHDAEKFNVHWLTEGPPGANTVGIQFEALAGPEGCAVFSGIFDGVTYLSENYGRIVDGCNGLDPVLGEFVFGEGPDGAGLATLTLPRSASPLLADGSVISAPTARSWIFAGGEQITPSGYRGVRQRVDDTQVGTDYAISDSEVTPTPPGKADPPGKKKGCAKGKGKKPGCEGKGKKAPKPGKPAAECAPFKSPNDAYKDNPLVVLTDEATEEKPVEQTVAMDASLADLSFGLTSAGPFAATADAFNIQVDSDAADAGLYALLEFAPRRDYDLNLMHDDGSFAAQARSFNTGLETPFSQPGHGGEGTDRSEKLVGIRTSDCGGWTLSVENHFGEGGELTVKLWLGEPTIDPLEPGTETP